MTDEIAKWEPAKFDGSDLLPQAAATDLAINAAPLIEEEDLESEDIVLPVLQVLQGTSDPVSKQVDGAVPGKLYFSGNGQVITPPMRMIVVHRFRGNALFPKKQNPAHEGLEMCISRDGVTGSVYGECETCKKCTEWGPNNEPPVGSKTQQFIVLTSLGLCMLRVQLSHKVVTRLTRQFMTLKATTRRNWFCHPTILRVDTVSSDENTWFVPRMAWQESEIVPEAIQRECYGWYKKVTDALETGSLSEDESDDHPTGPTSAESSTDSRPSPDIPF